MQLKWKIVGDHINFELMAPDDGWVAIGFNKTNTILHADLYQFRVKDGEVEGRDLWAKGLSDPRLDTSLNGTNNLENVSGNEQSEKTTASFSLPLYSAESTDLGLTPGKEIWLILAYSMSDDWDHHSRVRKHLLWTP